MKNALCLLLFSAGTPMLLAGDEWGRTQKGNNNAYCQDNEISWFDWTLINKNKELFEFAKRCITLRQKYSVFKRNSFYTGKKKQDAGIPDITWFNKNLGDVFWQDQKQKIICFQLNGNKVLSDKNNYFIFVILNADFRVHRVRLPQHTGKRWYKLIDTFLDKEISTDDVEVLPVQEQYIANGRSVVVLVAEE